MYGMVNRAIEGLVVENHGEEVWEEIVEKSGVEEDTFISLEQYDDDITYKLVGAASEVLGVPASDLLVAFGAYWTKYVGTAGYGAMMDIKGRSLVDFLSSLDEMHSRVAMTMSGLRPPSFTCTEISEGVLDITYASGREGLGHMVVGLLQGVLEIKGVEGTVEWTEKTAEGAAIDVFRIVTEEATVSVTAE